VHLKDLSIDWIKENIDMLYKEINSVEDVIRIKNLIQNK